MLVIGRPPEERKSKTRWRRVRANSGEYPDKPRNNNEPPPVPRDAEPRDAEPHEVSCAWSVVEWRLKQMLVIGRPPELRRSKTRRRRVCAKAGEYPDKPRSNNEPPPVPRDAEPHEVSCAWSVAEWRLKQMLVIGRPPEERKSKTRRRRVRANAAECSDKPRSNNEPPPVPRDAEPHEVSCAWSVVVWRPKQMLVIGRPPELRRSNTRRRRVRANARGYPDKPRNNNEPPPVPRDAEPHEVSYAWSHADTTPNPTTQVGRHSSTNTHPWRQSTAYPPTREAIRTSSHEARPESIGKSRLQKIARCPSKDTARILLQRGS